MQNPLRDVRIFRLTKEADKSEQIIITAYSRSGLTVSAWDGYSDKVIGRARGGGYDKTHTAVAIAAGRIIAEHDGKVIVSFGHAGSSGFMAVARACEIYGWKLEKIA